MPSGVKNKVRLEERRLDPQSRPVTLLLTATVSPPSGMPDLMRKDPSTRLAEYGNALKFYFSTSDSVIGQIIILENSGFNLDAFYSLYQQSGCKKSFYSLGTSSTYDSSRGKGFAEFKMIDEGVQRLRANGRVQDDCILWKVTGRVIVSNIEPLIKSMPPRSEVYCDLRHVPLIGDSLGGNDWMDLRVFAISVIEYMTVLAGKYDSDYVLEKEFFKLVQGRLKDYPTKVAPRFLKQPYLVGVSGYSNKSYNRTGYRAKSALRALTRKALPILWL